MTEARRAVTSIVRFAGAPSGLKPALVTKELVPMREEVFRTDSLSTPQGVQDALHKVQRHLAESTQAARSLPLQGGVYCPSVAFTANTAHVIQHGLPGGVEVAWVALSCRPATANAAAVTQGRLIEVAQDAPRGRLTLASSEAATYDLWIAIRPNASEP